jgi:hypothetical protein
MPSHLVVTRMLALTVTLTLQGCAPNGHGIVLNVDGSSDTTHFVVLGFGVVSIPKKPDTPVTAIRTQSLGLAVTDLPGSSVSLGYASGQIVAMPDGVEDVVVEFESAPFGAVCLRAPKRDATDANSNTSACQIKGTEK